MPIAEIFGAVFLVVFTAAITSYLVAGRVDQDRPRLQTRGLWLVRLSGPTAGIVMISFITAYVVTKQMTEPPKKPKQEKSGVEKSLKEETNKHALLVARAANQQALNKFRLTNQLACMDQYVADPAAQEQCLDCLISKWSELSKSDGSTSTATPPAVPGGAATGRAKESATDTGGIGGKGNERD